MGEASTATVRLPQALAEHAGGARELSIPVLPGGTLRDLLDALDRSVPAVGRRVRDETGTVRRFVNVYVGDDECRTLDGQATPVPPGTVVYVIGSVAGG